ncbi:hypothetical protein SHJG_1472 [Streptomyces hygroscopicus subsp. jinggangensis 5008]|nr:hypothetical protein SHJG_1472 [Streptomyces hygroscopicus subsp. jinggangensis 5008]AGF60969.1 hypothetical protein SHJGH_1303 [Streptomyces hygroscopicus subsp. jinggangensis TL01]
MSRRSRPARALRAGRAQRNGPLAPAWTVSTSSRSRPMTSWSGRRAAHCRCRTSVSSGSGSRPACARRHAAW